MSLTATSIRNIKPKDKTFKLYDERGLYLKVSPNGRKWWRYKYRFSGKEKRISLGVYPDVSLKEARDRGGSSIFYYRQLKIKFPKKCNDRVANAREGIKIRMKIIFSFVFP